MLGAGFAMQGMDLLHMSWICSENCDLGLTLLLPCKVLQQPELDPSHLRSPRVASSHRHGFGGVDLPFQPISPLPQESLREGPRCIWTPCAMASSELSPRPAVGTVNPWELG